MTYLSRVPWKIQDREARIQKWAAATREQRAERRQRIIDALESARDSQTAEGFRAKLKEMDEVEARLQGNQDD